MYIYQFIDTDPTLYSYWRSVVLFGRNVATYKLALARALLSISDSKSDLVRIEDLAMPYAQYICEHLKEYEKQGLAAILLT